MIITLIAAMAENRVIGRDNALPWDLPEDRKRFRALTMGHPVIMGRRTWQSLPRPLDGRTVIVLSRNRELTLSDGIRAGSLEEALALAVKADGCDEVFIAGGGYLYRQALPIADRISLTVVYQTATGDVTFPDLPDGLFVETSREDFPGAPAASFIRLERATHSRHTSGGSPMEQHDDLNHLRRLWSFWSSRIILTANNYRVFDHLGQGKDASELATVLGVDHRGIEILMNALCGLGLAEKRDDRYVNTPLAEKYLVSGSPWYQGDMVKHYDILWQNWSALDEIVRTGRPVRRVADHPSFIRAMHNNAVFKARQVVDSLDLSGVRTVLDVAGGPGTYSMELARRGVDVTHFDFPETIAIAREIAAEAGVTITFRPGDALADPVGEGYDLIFISHLFHSYSPDDNRRILDNCRKGLNPGGQIVVQEFLIDDTLTQPTMGALFAVNMLVNTEGGRCYSPTEIARWLTDTGLSETSEIRLDETVLVVGR